MRMSARLGVWDRNRVWPDSRRDQFEFGGRLQPLVEGRIANFGIKWMDLILLKNMNNRLTKCCKKKLIIFKQRI